MMYLGITDRGLAERMEIGGRAGVSYGLLPEGSEMNDTSFDAYGRS